MSVTDVPTDVVRELVLTYRPGRYLALSSAERERLAARKELQEEARRSLAAAEAREAAELTKLLELTRSWSAEGGGQHAEAMSHQSQKYEDAKKEVYQRRLATGRSRLRLPRSQEDDFALGEVAAILEGTEFLVWSQLQAREQTGLDTPLERLYGVAPESKYQVYGGEIVVRRLGLNSPLELIIDLGPLALSATGGSAAALAWGLLRLVDKWIDIREHRARANVAVALADYQVAALELLTSEIEKSGGGRGDDPVTRRRLKAAAEALLRIESGKVSQ